MLALPNQHNEHMFAVFAGVLVLLTCCFRERECNGGVYEENTSLPYSDACPSESTQQTYVCGGFAVHTSSFLGAIFTVYVHVLAASVKERAMELFTSITTIFLTQMLALPDQHNKHMFAMCLLYTCLLFFGAISTVYAHVLPTCYFREREGNGVVYEQNTKLLHTGSSVVFFPRYFC